MNKEIIVLSPAAVVSMADEWYAFATTDHFWMQWRFNVLLAQLKKFAPGYDTGRFLEIGCGHGQFMQQMDAIGKTITDGCDLNLGALKMIRETKGDIFVYDINQNHPQMVNKYAGVFLLDVIEHIDDDDTFLMNALNHAKPGGLICINVPALQGLYSRYDTAAGHKRRYTKERMEKLFRQRGIAPVHIGYWGFSLLGIALLRKVYLKFVSANKIIEKGFKPPASVVNSVFKMLMKFEMFLFKNPVLGTSLVAIGRKGKY